VHERRHVQPTEPNGEERYCSFGTLSVSLGKCVRRSVVSMETRYKTRLSYLQLDQKLETINGRVSVGITVPIFADRKHLWVIVVVVIIIITYYLYSSIAFVIMN
jgi:hypothetical protein